MKGTARKHRKNVRCAAQQCQEMGKFAVYSNRKFVCMFCLEHAVRAREALELTK